jgi:L-ascorbate metabolism protein UlaG (beta-lactamase superfamily)
MTRSQKIFLASAVAFLGLAASAAIAVALWVRAGVRAAPVLVRHLPAPPPNVNSFVVTSPQGIRVFLDVVSVPDDLLPAIEDPRSLFLVTHRHSDHLAGAVADRFRGGKLVGEAGTLVSGDVKVEVVRSSHIDDEIDGTNHIVVVDVGGTRIAHFGDCGQERLTPEQLARIGRVDLMLGQLENMFADADIMNRKGFKIAAQVSPTLLVPTHIVGTAAVKLLGEDRALEQTTKTELVLTPALLAKGKRAIFMGGNLPLASQAGVPPSPDL